MAQEGMIGSAESEREGTHLQGSDLEVDEREEVLRRHQDIAQGARRR